MLYHHHGYVSHDPRIQTATGTGLNRTKELPEKMDVLIIGAGPAGMIAAAQLSQFPSVSCRIIDKRPSRLEIGLADGMQKRSLETFQAFGFADKIMEEACHISETTFWKPDPDALENIKRVSRIDEDPNDISEFPHVTVNHARVLDYFAEFMGNSPSRMQPDYGYELKELNIASSGEYPVTATLIHTSGPEEGQLVTVKARYVLGTDGAHSSVRKSIGLKLHGVSSNHAWGVLDLLADTDFPDIRTKAVIQSENDGNILLIPREGGFLFRFYVDMGDVAVDDNKAIRKTPVEKVIERAQKIMHPYKLDVRHVAWFSIYEVGHRLCDQFDNSSLQLQPSVFIAGDASHTHSAKAGQGTNASMQDGFNIGWKLGHVLEGRSPAKLLSTYSAERQQVGQSLIDHDLRWASQMAQKSESFSQDEIEQAYMDITEFAQGFTTEYQESPITGKTKHQNLATGFPIGKRFHSAYVTRLADAYKMQLGHHIRADGRWRIYVFADEQLAGASADLAKLNTWLLNSEDSPINGYTPSNLDKNSWFDIKIIYQQDYTNIDINLVPEAFKPRMGPWQLENLENIYASLPEQDIFALRGISKSGAIIIVRPDQYVANILPLTATNEFAQFLAGFAAKQK